MGAFRRAVFSYALLIALGGIASPAICFGSGPNEAQTTYPAPPQLSIDDSRFPALVVQAHDTPIAYVLKLLGERRQIRIEGLPVNDTQVINGTFKGDFLDLLRRDLPDGFGYVIIYQRGQPKRAIILGSPRGYPSAAASNGDASGETQKLTDSTNHPSWVPSVEPSDGANRLAPRPQTAVNKLLQDSASHVVSAFREGAEANPGLRLSSPAFGSMTGTQASLARMTETARTNVQALASALRMVCIGQNCSQ
jgi:hypothetical protein